METVLSLLIRAGVPNGIWVAREGLYLQSHCWAQRYGVGKVATVHSHSFPGQISRDLVFQQISWKMPHNEDILCYVLYLCYHLILTEIITSISE